MQPLHTARPMKILLGYDGSSHAKAAIKMICDLPLAADSTVFLLGVFTPRQISDHELLRVSIEEASQCIQARGLGFKTEMILGHPAEKLIEHAEKLQPDLLVVGAKGLRATFGILLGGVAQQVVEYANWPVLVVREPYHPVKRILLVTDGSPFSQCALEYTCEMPLPEGIDIRIMHVLPPLIQPEIIAQMWPATPGAIPPPDLPTLESWRKEEEEQAQTVLEQAQRTLASAGREAGTVMRRGDAATEILEYCRQYEPNLIIAGSRGLSQVRSWLLGSVSRKLIHYADTSILIVKRCTTDG